MSIYKKMIAVVGIISCVFFIAGCATLINVSEIMQHPAGTKYYLAHNVWTHGSRHSISSINYQVGSIIPFGTQVTVVKATTGSIRLQIVSSGAEFTIKYYEKYGMKPMADYIKQLLTTENRSEMTKGMSQEFVNAMLGGSVLPDMTKKQVILTYGPPSPHRTPTQDSTTWVYWIRRFPISETSRVVFKDDKVLHVLR